MATPYKYHSCMSHMSIIHILTYYFEVAITRNFKFNQNKMFHRKVTQVLQMHRRYSSKIRLKSDPYQLSSMDIRNIFLDYFIDEHNHKFIRSSPVIPFCDPTVPFVNAGMNQFKNIFLGKTTAAFKTAVNSQKCIRVGGKHNDLNLIGMDGYHHTFFEMLGNWLFGDYFKEKSCNLAWDLLTNAYKIDPNRLYVTYFGGDLALGLKPDLECRDIWLSTGVPADRILPFGGKENFWEMGATGPCGTCTEIHIGHLPNSNPAQRAQFVNAGLHDLTELWNVVFIEYNRNSDGTLEPLKEKFIDTGMGFERLVAVLQGKSSNYDTDLFLPIFDAISKESGKSPYSGIYNLNVTSGELDYAYRVVADHARMCSVCIADGMYPQTNHRLRRIMRKTLNICEQKFEKKHLIQKAIIPKIVESLGFVYPELDKNAKSICDIFAYEEELYKAAVEKNQKNFKLLKLSPESQLKDYDVVDCSGFGLAYRDIEKFLKSNKNLKTLPVKYMFHRLYTSFGLKEELIEKLAAEMNVEVDMKQFEVYKRIKKKEAKSQHKIEDGALLEKLMSEKVPETHYQYMYDYKFDNKSRKFHVNPLKAKIAFMDSNEDDDLHHIILDKTNFYHTAGGQDCDIGQIIGSNSTFNVEKVQICKGYVIHTGRFLNATKPFELNEEVNVVVDPSHRTYLSQHHTAMHLLQAAVKKVTNRIVFQESSHVSAENLKCELGVIGKQISLDQLEEIEKLIRQVIQSKIPIETEYLAAHELYSLNNLTTVPGAIHPDNDIRLLKVKDENNEFESFEPCCGTHARNTSELEDFCFVSLKSANCSYDITAVAGRLVETMKLQEKSFLHNFEAFKEHIDSDLMDIIDLEEIEWEVNEMKQLISECKLPYITAARILSELEIIDKRIRTTKRGKHKHGLSVSTLDEIQCIDPVDFLEILQRTKALATKRFEKPFLADEKSRFVKSYQLKSNMNDLRSELKKVKFLVDVHRIHALAEVIRNDIKNGLYSYEEKIKCLDELKEINDLLIDTQHELEKQLYNLAFEDALTTSSLNKKTCMFHVIQTKHPLLTRTIIRMTDQSDVALVLIVISKSDVIGRVSIPLKYTNENLTAKDLSDEFNDVLGGKCIHHGTRLEASISDFQLKKDFVSEQSLKEVFKQIESAFNIL